MSILQRFDLKQLLDPSLSVLVAFILATLIGAEPQYRQRSAGLRTNVLVAVGAATFVSLGSRLSGNAGAAKLASYVVSGIGFLGADAIMNEAAGLLSGRWHPVGYGLMAEAGVVTAAVPAGNTLLAAGQRDQSRFTRRAKVGSAL
jgi:putative Mg2+ transporter-C (MgtC) family protein